MRFRAFLQVIVAGAAALLLAASGGMGFLGFQRPVAQAVGLAPERIVPKAIAFVPQRTIALGTLLLDASDWEAAQLDAVSSQQKRQLRRQLADLKGSLRRFGIRYDRDIKPWIGPEATVALVSRDEDRNPDNGQQPGYLLAIATDDAQASEAFLERLWRRQDDPQTVRQAGIEITYSQAPGAAMATAQVGRQFVLLASHLSVLQDALSSAQAPPLNIRARGQYQAAIAQLPEQAIGYVLGNPSQLKPYLSPGLQKLWTLPPDPAEPAGLQLLAAATLVDNDILLHTGPRPTDQALSPDDISAAPAASLAPWLPQGGTAAILDLDLEARWSDALFETDSIGANSAGGNSAGAAVLAAIAPDDLDALGADVQEIRDWVVPWVNQAYGVAKLPQLAGRDQPDWLFVTPVDGAVQAGLQDLDRRAQSQGLTVGHIPYAKQELTVWTALSAGVPANEPGGDIPTLIAEVKGVHAVVDDTALLATSIGAIAQALQAVEADGMAPLVKTLGPSPSYLRFAWPLVPDLLTQATGDRRLAQWAEPLQGIVEAVTLTPSEDPNRHTDLLLELVGD